MSFFAQKKPKQFNFKPVYLKEKQEEKVGFSKKMTDQWNRTSYEQLAKQGRKRILRTIVFIVALFYLTAELYEYFTQSL